MIMKNCGEMQFCRREGGRQVVAEHYIAQLCQPGHWAQILHVNIYTRKISSFLLLGPRDVVLCDCCLMKLMENIFLIVLTKTNPRFYCRSQ